MTTHTVANLEVILLLALLVNQILNWQMNASPGIRSVLVLAAPMLRDLVFLITLQSLVLVSLKVHARRRSLKSVMLLMNY